MSRLVIIRERPYPLATVIATCKEGKTIRPWDLIPALAAMVRVKFFE